MSQPEKDLPPSAIEFKRLREALGLSQNQLAAELGKKDDRQIRRWERGEKPVDLAALKLLRLMTPRPIRTSADTSDGAGFRFIDLFAGIGGMRIGFERAGGTCVFTCEWDKYANKTYLANWPDDGHIAGDIRLEADSQDIPPYDVLVAGFPCQPFSIAGVSKKNSLGRPHGFACEAQGTLFFELARIIKDTKPKAFLLENVKNLASHDRGNTLRVIRGVLEDELDYQVFEAVVDARCVVPQHRERVFLVGFQKPAPDFSWERDVDLPSADSGPRVGHILHGGDVAWPVDPGDARYVDDTGHTLSKYTLSPLLWRYLKQYAAKHKAKGNGFGYGVVRPDSVSRTLSARYFKDGSEILVHVPRKRPRRLTPRECARLMGFDRPNSDRAFVIPVSDTQAYRQFGNAVVPIVVEAIAKAIATHLGPMHSPTRTGTSR